jgi:hypothetical protein
MSRSEDDTDFALNPAPTAQTTASLSRTDTQP